MKSEQENKHKMIFDPEWEYFEIYCPREGKLLLTQEAKFCPMCGKKINDPTPDHESKATS